MSHATPPSGITTRIQQHESEGISHEKPVGFSATVFGERLEIVVPARLEPVAFFVGPFLVVWALGFFSMLLTISFGIPGIQSFSFVAVVITVVVAAIFFLRHRLLGGHMITVDQRELICRRWFLLRESTTQMSRADIEQFFVAKKKGRYKLFVEGDGREIEVLKVKTYAQALFVEDFLEKHLGIEDVRVDGEDYKFRPEAEG